MMEETLARKERLREAEGKQTGWIWSGRARDAGRAPSLRTAGVEADRL